MKNKKASKKLMFKKETVTNLLEKEQDEIRGGLPGTSWGHRYNCYSECNTGICCEFTLWQYTCDCM